MTPAMLVLVLSAAVVMTTASEPLAATSLSRLNSTCRLRRIFHTVRFKDCVPKKMLSYACHGTCTSYTQVSAADLTLERRCDCCQAMSAHEVTVRLLCPASLAGVAGRVRVPVRVSLPASCMCRPCSAVMDTVKPQEFDDFDEDDKSLWDVVMLN